MVSVNTYLRETLPIVAGNNEELIDAYIQDLDLYTRSENTKTMSRSILKMFAVHLGAKSFIDAGRTELILNNFYKFLVDEGLVSGNPVGAIKKYLKEYKKHDSSQHRQVISVEDASRLVNATFSTREKTILTLGFKIGLRRHEICDLNVENLDLDNLTIRVTATRSISRQNRHGYRAEQS